jgi:hypothetical protein
MSNIQYHIGPRSYGKSMHALDYYMNRLIEENKPVMPKIHYVDKRRFSPLTTFGWERIKNDTDKYLNAIKIRNNFCH